MVAPDITSVASPSVGYHDTATNTSVRNVAQGLNGGVVEFYEREREPNIGALLSIKKYDQSLNNLLATPWQASTTAAGAPSVGRAPGHQLDEVIIDGVSFNQSHDQRGRLQDALDMVLHYDGLNRLSHVSDTLDENVLESFLYDGDGRMISQIDHLTNTQQVLAG